MSDDELLAIFRAEVEEQLTALDERLAAAPADWDADDLYRIAHNVKGAARMVDAQAVRDVAHELEDVLADWRAGAAELDDARVAAIRAGVEALRTQFLSDVAAPVAGAELSAAEPGGDAAAENATLRVRTDRLDRLLALAPGAAELGHALAGLQQTVDALGHDWELWRRRHPEAARDAAARQVERRLKGMRREFNQHQGHHNQWLAQLNDALRRLRMVRVGSLAAMWRRVLHDATEVADVEAELAIEGEATEVDRAVLEALRDPINHLLRNAVAHGIERPDDRAAAGKGRAGRIVVGAAVRGSWVCVTVGDDGRGVDTAAVEAQDGGGTWQERIFRAGVSTAAQVDELAGRGVGLDVVARNVEGLGGRIEVRTERGRGTTFSLHVPLTRLLTQGIVVRMADVHLAVPVDYVERTLRTQPEDLRRADGRPMLVVDDEPVPLCDLGGMLQLTAETQGIVPAVVVRDRTRRAAFLVDDVLGDRAFAVQPLPWQVRHLPGVSGTTIVDHDRIAYVVDAPALFDVAPTQRSAGRRQRQDKRHRVLVVDDSVTSRTLERNILAAAGYEVNVATDGAEAWRMLSTREVEVDAVVTDVEMPHMSGLELARMIREHEGLGHTPIVLVTSLGDEQDRQAGASAGADAYVVKGEFDQDELLRTLQRLL